MTLLEWPGGSWESTLGIGGMLVFAYIALIWLALVFWTVRDAHLRTRSTATQISAGLLVLFFFLPGQWLYLILRPRLTLAERYERTLEAEAVLFELSERAACPRCGRRVRDDFVHCPSCRATLKRACARCQRPMDFAWVMCPSCGLEPRRPQARPEMRPEERPATPPAAATTPDTTEPAAAPSLPAPAQMTPAPAPVPVATAHGPRPSAPRKPRRGMGPLPRPGVPTPPRPEEELAPAGSEERPPVAATVASSPAASPPGANGAGALGERGLAGGTPGS